MAANVLVIIPALNEQDSLPGTIGRLRAQGFQNILVVDDGSQDQTAEQALRHHVNLLRMPFNTGIGGAVSLGLSYASRRKFQAVLRVDADGQHDESYAHSVLRPVLEGKVQLCVGSRFLAPLEQETYRSSVCRRIGIRFFSCLITALTGQRITDPTSGFNAFGPRAIALFSQSYPEDYPEPETIVTAIRSGLGFCEVPVAMRPRQSGNSSIRYLRTLYYMVNVTLAIMLNYLRPVKHVPSEDRERE